MGRVKVHISSIIARGLKVGRSFNLEAGTIHELIDELARKLGEEFRKKVCDERGEIKRQIIVLVNNKNIRLLNGLKTALKDGDIVMILPAVAGG